MRKQLCFAVLILSQLYSAIAIGAEASASPKQGLSSFISIYQSSRTARELIQKMPMFGPDAEEMHEVIWGRQMDEPLPPISFDLSRRSITIQNQTLQFDSNDITQMKINGRAYIWDVEKTYYENMGQIYLLNSKHEKTGFYSLVIKSAWAQDRDFFPEVDAGAQQKQAATESTGSRLSNLLSLSGFGGFLKGATVAKTVLAGLSKLSWVMVAADYVVNFEHAALAHALSGCESQAQKLKRIMNENHISLADFRCSNGLLGISNRKNNIAFWTPDKKKLPFVASWETSELYVDERKEVYKFDFRSLQSVNKAGGASVTFGPEFDKYKKNLEPYRKILFEIGKRNSCFSCEAEFKKLLVRSQPGPYPDVPSAPQKAGAK
jgi:hypothetical protein